MIGMRLTFYFNIWNMIRSKVMSSVEMLIGWSCIKWSGIGKTQVELVSALKEDPASSSLAALVVKVETSEEIFVVDV